MPPADRVEYAPLQHPVWHWPPEWTGRRTMHGVPIYTAAEYEAAGRPLYGVVDYFSHTLDAKLL